MPSNNPLSFLCVPGLTIVSPAATGRSHPTFTFGQSRQGCQVWVGPRQVGATALLLLLLLLLLATPFGTATGYSVRPYQHPVARVAMEVVLTAH